MANERMQISSAGNVVTTLRRDGAAHTVMSPLEFTQRLAALRPRPGQNSVGRPLKALNLVDQTPA